MTSHTEESSKSSTAGGNGSSAREVFISPQQLADGQSPAQETRPSYAGMGLILFVMAGIAFAPWVMHKLHPPDPKAANSVRFLEHQDDWNRSRIVTDRRNWGKIFQEAINEERHQRYGEAIHNYTTLLEVSEDKAQILYHRGKCHLKMNEVDSALDDLNEAIRQYPDPDFYAERAAAYRASGNEDKAREDEAVVAKHGR